MNTKQHLSTVTEIGNSSGQPNMIVTTPDVDREFDRVIPSGISFTNFLRNPALFWGHAHSEIPIGTVTRLTPEPRGLRAFWKWVEGDTFADRVRNAWEQGAVRAASIGFTVKNSKPNQSGGRDFTETELLEISLVGLPANPQAVRTLKQFGLYEESDDILSIDLPTRTRAPWLNETLVFDSEWIDPTVMVFDESDLQDGTREGLSRLVWSALTDMATATTGRMFDLNPPRGWRHGSIDLTNAQQVRAAVQDAVLNEVQRQVRR